MMPHIFENGSTIMEYNIIKQVDTDEIKSIIYKNTNIEKDKISINVEESNLRIEFDYVDIEKRRELEKIIGSKFDESIQAFHMASFGPQDLNSKFIIIFSIYFIIFITGVICFVIGIFLFIKKLKKKIPSNDLIE
jgi:hypothetical protein